MKGLWSIRVSCHPAVMASFSTKESLQSLKEQLAGISRKLAEDLEVEELILYPHVRRKIARYGLKYYTGYSPDSVPPEQV